MPVPFILDTDTAQDDCIAILLSLHDPLADLQAITMVAGNVRFEQQVRNAFMALSVAERVGRVPIYLGSRKPLMRQWVSAEYVHGDGSGGMSMDMSGYGPEPQHAVDALIERVSARPGELSIVAIGPLTNIALAALKDPRFAGNVKQLVIMGGSNNARGNVTAAAEFNFYVDPEAAQIVFQAGFNITVIPWAPLTLNDAVFTRDRLSVLHALNTPLAHFFERICHRTLLFDEQVGIPGTTHPDSLSVAVLLHPDLIQQANPYHVAIEINSELTRGYSFMSWGVHGLEANATIVEAIDRERFYRMIHDMLARETMPTREIHGIRAALE